MHELCTSYTLFLNWILTHTYKTLFFSQSKNAASSIFRNKVTPSLRNTQKTPFLTLLMLSDSVRYSVCDNKNCFRKISSQHITSITNFPPHPLCSSHDNSFLTRSTISNAPRDDNATCNYKLKNKAKTKDGGTHQGCDCVPPGLCCSAKIFPATNSKKIARAFQRM